MLPTVSVIVVNWNGEKVLPECLESLKAQAFKDFEIVVVDNDTKNRGFAGGVNVGIRQAKGKYIALLNNDARANKHWLEYLVRVADHTDSRIGMFASKVLTTGGKIESEGCHIYPDGNGMCIRNGRNPDFPSGCAAMYRREMLDKIGFFDESFFMYNEDTEIGIRAKKAGYYCFVVPQAVVIHKGSSSTSRNSLKKLYWVERNRLRIMFKHFTWWEMIKSIPWTFIRYAEGGR